ncbi:tetratricopeptide repeat protein [Dictyobacter arantiisoli]|uniref:Uncharacterized protein n=1 Tax=Dictyobacter arantiisoli TaxID=2014874 RepID=A0A5A5T9B7_9CHLR|nr:tetratricopeptide repeat protein [Dictyobacter arantiisoli]GCF07589.1 hypothetical protein KDI_11530 [Dictyobacter arantiisoli]
MSTLKQQKVEICIVYAEEDTSIFDVFEVHLRSLIKHAICQQWTCLRLNAARKPDPVVIKDAQIICLLMSDHFMDAVVENTAVFELLLERYHNGSVIVMPILLHELIWDAWRASELKACLERSRPIITWLAEEHDFAYVQEGIEIACEQLEVRSQREDSFAFYLSVQDMYESVLSDQAGGCTKTDDDTITCLDMLTTFYVRRALYVEAQQTAQRALRQRQSMSGTKRTEIVASMDKLAFIELRLGHYDAAEDLYKQVLTNEPLTERSIAPSIHAGRLNNLGVLYQRKAYYAEAQALFQRAIEIAEGERDIEDHSIVRSINNLISVLKIQGKDSEIAALQ